MIQQVNKDDCSIKAIIPDSKGNVKAVTEIESKEDYDKFIEFPVDQRITRAT
jgi:hypothetical protein